MSKREAHPHICERVLCGGGGVVDICSVLSSCSAICHEPKRDEDKNYMYEGRSKKLDSMLEGDLTLVTVRHLQHLVSPGH
jgi:hypothetical protein